MRGIVEEVKLIDAIMHRLFFELWSSAILLFKNIDHSIFNLTEKSFIVEKQKCLTTEFYFISYYIRYYIQGIHKGAVYCYSFIFVVWHYD